MPFAEWMQKAVRKLTFSAGGASGGPGNWWGGIVPLPTPGAQHNYVREVGPLWSASSVMACLSWITRNFSEPPLVVTREAADGAQPVPRHPMVELIDQPNAFYDGDALWAATMLSYFCDGNAYWLKARDGSGRVRELWYAPHTLMRPVWEFGDNKPFIDHYAWSPAGKPIAYPVEDVVHFRHLPDPDTMGRRGTSPLLTCLREIATDHQASTYTAALLRNSGVPAVQLILGPVSPGGAYPKVTEESAKEIQDRFVDRFTGDQRFRPFVPTSPMEVKPIGFSPEEMALDKVLSRPEMRIAACFGLDPMLVHLNVGAVNKKYANYQEARTAGYDDCLKPTQRRCARILTRQLLREFTEDAAFSCAFDYSECMPEDRGQIVTRVVAGWSGGVMKRSEARSELGLPYDADDEIYKAEPAAADPLAEPLADPAAEKPMKPDDRSSGEPDEEAPDVQDA